MRTRMHASINLKEASLFWQRSICPWVISELMKAKHYQTKKEQDIAQTFFDRAWDKEWHSHNITTARKLWDTEVIY